MYAHGRYDLFGVCVYVVGRDRAASKTWTTAIKKKDHFSVVYS